MCLPGLNILEKKQHFTIINKVICKNPCAAGGGASRRSSPTQAAASFTSTFWQNSGCERETTFLGFGSVSICLFFFCQVNRSHVATNWEVFAYHYVNEIFFMLEKKQKRTKTKRKQRGLKTLTPSGHGYRQSKLLGEAAVFRWGQVLRSGWHGGWLGSARLAAVTSQRLALQRHHHVPTQLLGQRGAVLDVIQPVHLPLVFDT